jgi:hypothetical protein
VAVDVRTEDTTLRTHAKIDRLDDVHEGFVLLVLDVWSAPVCRPSGLNCDLRGFGLEKRDEWLPLLIMVPPTASVEVETTLSVVMYDFNVSISLFWGYPKSMISGKKRLSL